MIYFLNSGFGENKSGIEHAEIKRIHLFDYHHQPCTLVTREWDRSLHSITAKAGISDNQLLNLYDFYQGTRHVDSVRVGYKDVDLGISDVNYHRDENNQRYLAYREDGRLIARINYDPDDHDQVISTEMFDGELNLYAVVIYDKRGLRSKIDWYSPDNHVERSEWVNLNGQVVIEQYNDFDPEAKKNDKMVTTGYRLCDRRGKVLNFYTFAGLYQKFLNDINAHGQNILISDRGLVSDQQILHLDRPAYKVLHLHNSQAVDVQDEMHSDLNDNYEYSLWNIDQFDAIISSTKKQTRDVIARFHPQHAHMFTIPVGIVPDQQLRAKRVSVSQRTPGKVIIVARVAPEKQMSRIVKSLAMVKKDVPSVSLDIWGYVNSDKEKAKIIKTANECGMADAVHFKGYTTNLSAVYDHARVFALASEMEGFNLAIMEAISHGVVGVTYDTNYGPNEIIEDGQNGYVVPFDDEKAMARRISELLSDDHKLQQFSDAAYDSAQRYSGDNVWKNWQQLINDAKRSFGEAK